MKIAVLKERRTGERRVAATPETVKKFVEIGAAVVVETDAGTGANYSDADYQHAGAIIGSNSVDTLDGADVILKVRRPIINTTNVPC